MADDFPYAVDAATLEKAAAVKLLVLDVDGVLTRGNLYFGASGETMKEFSILDGLGIKLLQTAGIPAGIITGRLSGMVSKRMQELGITQVMQGREDKLVALRELLANNHLSLEQVCYVGDDLPDLAAIQASAFGVAVANAHPAVRQRADWVCEAHGGQGAVREVCDIILHAKGTYQAVIEHYCFE